MAPREAWKSYLSRPSGDPELQLPAREGQAGRGASLKGTAARTSAPASVRERRAQRRAGKPSGPSH
jgi:hypothetical protein